MKKTYIKPRLQQYDLVAEDAILGLSQEVGIIQEQRPGTDAWAEKKNPWDTEDMWK